VLFFIPKLAVFFNDTFLPPMTRMVRFPLVGLFFVMSCLYVLFLRAYKIENISFWGSDSGSVFFRTSGIVFLLILCSAAAVLSSDLYEYPMRARMLSIYGLNPYLHVPSEVQQDPFYQLIFWKDIPECYGPGWVLLGALSSLSFKNNVFLTVFAHKLLLMLFFIMSGYFFKKIADELRLEKADMLSVAFVANPILLTMTMIDGHNEIVMIAFLMASAYFLLKERYALSLVIMAAAINVKFVYVLLIPFWLLYILFKKGGSSLIGRIVKIAIGGISSLLLTVLLWSPFGVESVSAVLKYYKELSSNLWPDSIPYAVCALIGFLGCAVSLKTVAYIFSVIFAVVYFGSVFCFVKKINDDRQILFGIGGMVLLTLLFTNATPFQTWYVLWAVPLVLLSRIKTKFILVTLLTTFLMLTFWKRMSVLAVPMWSMYFIALKFKESKIVRLINLD